MSAPAPAVGLVPSDEEQEIRGAIRQLLEPLGPHYARDCWEREEPPSAAWDAISAAGFAGINIPGEWGGGGMGMQGLAVVIEETARTGAALLMLVVSSGIAGTVLARHGTDEQKERWLRGIAAGTTRIAFSITEPDAGSNSHQIRTELRRDGDRYLLKGQKYYISCVEHAHAILCIARLRREGGELGLPTICIVDADAAGLTKDPIPMPYLGADRQWTLFFDDVEITPDRLIGGEESGLAAVFDGLNPERIAGAAALTGGGLRALDKAVAYANERQVWKTPIGAHQAIGHPLAKAKIELELARLMNQKAAALWDADASPQLTGEAANMAKYAAAEAAVHAVDAAVQTHGGNGIALESGVSDLWWGARLGRIAPVSEQMILNHVAQHSLGLPKSY